MLTYAIIKYIAYSIWCYVGLRLLTPAQAKPGRAALYGALRWLLGLVLGIIVFLAAGSIDQTDAGRLYLLIYTPLRIVEWGIIAALIMRKLSDEQRGAVSWRMVAWVIGGIAVSYLSDLASPEGLAGKFCVGRCLC